jgi:hypothetical protein
MQTLRRLLLTLLLLAVSTPGFAQTRSAGLLNFHANASRFACSNRDSGTVTVVSWPELKKLHEIPVGLHPEGVAWIGTSSSIACCVYGSDEIVIIDADSGQITRRIAVFDEPYGVVSSADGKLLTVPSETPGLLAVCSADWLSPAINRRCWSQNISPPESSKSARQMGKCSEPGTPPPQITSHDRLSSHLRVIAHG